MTVCFRNRYDRQIDGKGSTLARLAIDLNKTMMSLHHPIDDGQSETSSFSSLLCAVKGFKNPGLGLLTNPNASIDHPNVNVTLGTHSREIFPKLLRFVDPSLQGNGSVVQNRVPC